jgi:hemerythrin
MAETELARGFEWIPEYAVNIPAVDREHQFFFAMVAALNQAMRDGEGRKELKTLLAKVVRYTQEHFSHEESLMAEAGYPGLAGHQRDHAELTSLALAFQQRFEGGETTITIEFMQFLGYWLRSHITTSDLQFSRYLKTQR